MLVVCARNLCGGSMLAARDESKPTRVLYKRLHCKVFLCTQRGYGRRRHMMRCQRTKHEMPASNTGILAKIKIDFD